MNKPEKDKKDIIGKNGENRQFLKEETKLANKERHEKVLALTSGMGNFNKEVSFFIHQIDQN